MPKKLILVIVVAVLGATYLLRGTGGPAASSTGSPAATPQPSATGTPKATETPVMMLPTATPEPAAVAGDAGLLENAIAKLHNGAPMHVHFDGIDGGGQLSFDVDTDGAGNLSGTYTRQGQTAELIVTGQTIYMRGDPVMESYTGIPISSSITGWVKLPPLTSPGFLGTVATSRMLADCMEATASQFTSGWFTTTPQLVGGNATLTLEPEASPPQPWMFAIDQTSGNLVSADFITFGAATMPPVCVDGVSQLTGMTAGNEGTLTFSAFHSPVPAITAPAGWVDYPPVQWDPEH